MVGARGGYADYVSATATSYPRRMLAFARFALTASLQALRGPRPDVVYATSPPLTIALPALLAAARHRAPLVFEVRDLWPEAPIQMGALRNPLARRLARALERFVYRRSTRVIALSPGIRDGIAGGGRGPRADRAGAERLRPRALLPGARPRAERARLGLGNGFVCSYFGTLGEANDLSQVVRAAPLLEGVTFVLLGDGKRRGDLEREARALGADNVVFLEPDPRQVHRGPPGRGVGRVPHDLQGRARARHQLAEQAVRHLRGRPAGDREPAGLDARARGDATRPGCSCARVTRPISRRRSPGCATTRDEAERYGRNARALAEREFDRDALAARALAVLEEAAG